MKALNKSRGSIVLAAVLFAVSGVSVTNAVVVIEGAEKSGNNWVGKNNPTKEAYIKISTKNTIDTTKEEEYDGKKLYGNYIVNHYNNQNNIIVDALNNKVEIIGLKSNFASVEVARSAYKPNFDNITKKEASHNSIYITGSKTNATGGIWSGRIDVDSNNPAHDFIGITNYNTTVLIDNEKIKHDVLRGAISYSDNAIANYNMLYVKNSTMYAPGGTYRITGGFVQEEEAASDSPDYKKAGNANFNQLIYEEVDTYVDENLGSTSENLFAGLGRIGIANDNRAYVKDLNKNVNESVTTIKTNVYGGATWRHNSGGADGNIAVAVGESKIANIYGGAVGLGAGNSTGKSNGANNNLVILDLIGNGKVTENVYGGYISDTTNATTTGNAVYFMQGNVTGAIIGGNKEKTNNTLILGKDKDKDNLGVIKVGGISGFDTLQFNAFTHGDTADKATLTLTNPQIGADLEGVAINVLKGDASGAVTVKVGGDNNSEVKIEERGDGGGENAITNLTKNAIKYGTNLDKIAIITGGAQANNGIKETLRRSRTDEEYQAKYGIGDTFNYTYYVIDLNKEKNKKFYLIKSATSLQNIIPDPNNNIKGIDIDWQNKAQRGETLKNGAKIVDAFQPDQIYKILDKDTYTRNLRGMFLENGDKDLFITGIDEITETWENDKFDTDEFTKFGKPSESGNEITIAKGAGELNKTIYGGESTDKPVSGNSIIIEEGANLSNATIIGGFSKSGKVSDNNISLNKDATSSGTTIIGGYSKSGEVSGNNIDLNKAENIKADIILAQTDDGSVKVSNDNIKNADGVTIGGSVTIAKSTGSANLNGLKFEMPKFKKITGDFTLADTNTGSANENSLTLNNDINVDGNIYTAKSLGNANENTLTLNGNVKANEIYVAKGADEANANTLEINGGVIDSSKVVVGSAKSANDNIANFNSGEITGTLHGGNGTGNTLNVKDTKLKAGNVADFNIMNFKQSYLSQTADDKNKAALILTGADNLDFSGVEVQIGEEKYNPKTDYGLGKEQKFYLVSSAAIEENYNSELFLNYKNSSLRNGVKGESITHWNDSKGYVIDAFQTNTEYIIDDPNIFTRDIRGMFVADDTKALYLTGNSKIKETIGDTIGGSDGFFTKFGGRDTNNTITISPNKGSELDLGDVMLDGGDFGKNNTLNVGTDKNRASVKAGNVKDFKNINIYLPENPKDDYTAISLSGGSETNLSKSNIKVFVDKLDDINGNGGTVHLVKAKEKIAKNVPDTVKVQVGALLDYTNTIKQTTDKTLDLFAKKPDPTPDPDPTPTPTPDPDPTPDPKPSINDQTKIFNEARIAGMAAVWEGSYLISNHLERIIPDGYTELFPYVIFEGYDKRYNTGSHVDSLGFNANAGLAGKAPNSKGEFTMGIFIEYGNVDYDAYLDDGTKGSGDAYYAGVGAFGKQENASGSYYEGSFRVGQLTTNFDGTLNFNGVSKYYDWGIDSTYYAVHVGGGKIVPLSESNDLDFYARYFYTHIDAADIKIDGVDTHFDALQSHKIRAGLQDNFKIDEHNKFFVGLAGEYEFSSEAGGRFIVPNGSTGEMLSPDLKGLTGIGEIGYQYKTETLKFDAGVKGYAGKQEGVSAQMALSIAF